MNLKSPSFAAALALLLAASLSAQAPQSGQGRGGQGAQGPSPAATATADGQAIVGDAIRAIDAQRSISAQMRHRISLFGHQLVGAGVYQQLDEGPQRRLRLDMKVKVADQQTSMQQICDGRFLWVRRELGETTSVGRVDLRRVRDAVGDSNDASLNAAAQWMLLGGLPQLLGQLERNFQFAEPRAATLENTRVIVLDGRWKPQALVAVAPHLKDKIAVGRSVDPDILPPQLPAHVRLVVRQADRFPIRIEYLRVGKASDADAPPLESIMTMELFDVRLNQEIDPIVFQYKPGNAEVADHTEVYLSGLGVTTRQAAQEEGTRR